jgi:hypothetical protein
MRRRPRARAWKLLLLAAAVLLPACGNQITPQPVTASGSALCYADYQTCINPILDASINGRTGAATCSAGGCHSQASGSGGAFKIFPGAQPDSAEMLANYFSAQSFANLDDPPSSRLLQKPTAGRSAAIGGHAGGDIFPGADDACHAAMLQWIANRVDDPAAAVCGACSAPAIASCGY